MPFSIKAKNFSITYPRSETLTHELIHNELNKHHPKYLVSSKESHEDGGTHYHIAIGFNDRKNFTGERCFDISGCHPNIQATRNPREWISYIKKDGDFRESGDIPGSKRKWSDALSATTKEEFFNVIKEVAPRDFILQNDKLLDYASRNYEKQPEFENETRNFQIPQELSSWIETYFTNNVSFVCFLRFAPGRGASTARPDSASLRGLRSLHWPSLRSGFLL